VAPKPTKADGTASARTNTVFVLPQEFYSPNHKELTVAQLDFGPGPVIFEKPREKNYKHLKVLYLKGYINGHSVNKMLVDTSATLNIMPYSVLHRLGSSTEDLIKTNVTLSDFNGQASEAQGVLNMDLTWEARLSQLPSSLSAARVCTLSCLGAIGFMPTAASLLRCTNV
jgi:hypothetical protein